MSINKITVCRYYHMYTLPLPPTWLRRHFETFSSDVVFTQLELCSNWNILFLNVSIPARTMCINGVVRQVPSRAWSYKVVFEPKKSFYREPKIGSERWQWVLKSHSLSRNTDVFLTQMNWNIISSMETIGWSRDAVAQLVRMHRILNTMPCSRRVAFE